MRRNVIDVAFPLYRLSSVIVHDTPRHPTVLERMLLRLCTRYREAPVIGAMRVVDVFEQQLGLVGAMALVGPCADSLIRLGAIERPAGHSSIMHATVGELQLTEKGHGLWQDNKVPAKERTNDTTHYLDPLTGTVLSESQSRKFLNNPQGLAVDSAALRPGDSSLAVSTFLERESHEWKTPSTFITSVRTQVTGELWQKYQIEITIANDGTVLLAAPSAPDLQQWLQRASDELVWTLLLEPLLDAPQVLDELPPLGCSLASAKEISPLLGASDTNLRDISAERPLLYLCRGGPTSISDDVPRIEFRASQLLADDPCNAHPLLAQLEDSVDLTEGLVGLALYGPGRPVTAWFSGPAQVFWNGSGRQANLRVVAGEADSEAAWADLRALIEASVPCDTDSRWAALACLWAPADQVIASWVSRHSALDIVSLLEAGADFSRGLKRFAPTTALAEWHTCLLGILKSTVIPRTQSIAASFILHVLQLSKRCLNTRATELEPLLLAKADSVDDLETLIAIRRAVAASRELPVALIGTEIQRLWLGQALEGEPTDLCGPHGLVQGFEAFHRACAALRESPGFDALLMADGDPLQLRRVGPRALDNVRAWQASTSSLFSGARTKAVEHPAKLQRMLLCSEQWQASVTRQLAPAVDAGMRLLVLDTNALLLEPQLLALMPTRDTPVLTHTVLQELDRHKSDTRPEREQRARQAQSANHAILRAKDRIRHEEAAPELLAAESKRDADDLILSVALKLRLSDTLLVTGDINLRNKAHAENVRTMAPAEYLQDIGAVAKDSTSSSGRNENKKRPRNR
ncbi:hypothetical protein D3C76_324750 [compost metagenome]